MVPPSDPELDRGALLRMFPDWPDIWSRGWWGSDVEDIRGSVMLGDTAWAFNSVVGEIDHGQNGSEAPSTGA